MPLPSTIVVAAPAPRMVRLYVPAGRLIVSAPGLALAAMIAPRRLQSFGAAVHAVADAVSSVRSTSYTAPQAEPTTKHETRNPSRPRMDGADSMIDGRKNSAGALFLAADVAPM